MCVLQMIEAVVQTRDAGEIAADGKRAHVPCNSKACPAPRELQHRQGQIDAHRSKSALREELDGQAGSTRDIEMRFCRGGKTREDSCQNPAQRAEESLSEGLVVGVSEGTVGFAQRGIA